MRRSEWSSLSAALLALALAVAGCSDPEPGPGPGPQGGLDAGLPDAGLPDAGLPDAGPTVGCVSVPERWAEWGPQWGTPRNDELLDVLVDPAGRLHLAGYEMGSLDEDGAGGDTVGTLLTLEWGAEAFTTQVLDRPGSSEVIAALALQPGTGKLYFTGSTTGAFPGHASAGRQDVIAGDLGPDGLLRVRYQGGTEHPQHPTRLAFDGAGDLLVAGYDDYTVQESAVVRWEDGFVLKLRESADGLQQLWHWQRDSAGSDLLFALGAGEASGAFYVGGGTGESAARGSYVQKRDAQGTLLWNVRQSDIAADAVGAVHVLPDGDVVVAGSTFRVLGAEGYGGQDAVVQRLDGASGAVRWTTQLGSAEGDWVTDLAVDPVDGSLTLVGETLGAVDPAHPNAGRSDAFLARLDREGRVLERRQWGTPGDERPTAVAVDACGRAFVVGYTTGALMGPNRGGRDEFVVHTERTR